MTDDLEIYLTSCQVGITASSIAVGIVAEPALAAVVEPVFEGSAVAGVGLGAVVAFVIINLVHLTHGEQTPTYLGVERTKTVCRYGARPLYWFTRLTRPIIAVGDTVAKWTLKLFGVEMTGAWLEAEQEAIETRADLRQKLSSTLAAGDLPEDRREEVVNALRVGEQPVADIMVPRDDVVSLSVSASTASNLAVMEEHPHTRFPLVGDTLEEFRGIVYMPAFVKHLREFADDELDFEAVASPPMTLSPETTVSDAIDRFQMEGQELALVVGDGEVRGLLTATDAFEAVVGDIEDPLDAEK